MKAVSEEPIFLTRNIISLAGKERGLANMRIGIIANSLLYGPLSIRKYLQGILVGFQICKNMCSNLKLTLLLTNMKAREIRQMLNVVEVISVQGIRDIDVLHIPDCGRSPPQIRLIRKAYKFEIPVVVTNHGMVNTVLPSSIVYGKVFSKPFLWDLMGLLKWYVIKKSIDAIIVPSRSERYYIAKALGLPLERLIVIHHGVNRRLYYPRPKQKCWTILETIYGMANDFILHVSSYQPKKNVEGIVAAYALLKRRFNIEEKLVIVGKQPKERLLHLAIRLGLSSKDILFTGVVPEKHLPYFYSAAKVFVFPSFHESFGMPILEAMACGCPVVTSNVFACPEVAGDAALLVNPFDIKDIALGIYRIIEDDALREELARRGIERSKLFTWRKSALMHLKIYESLMGDELY